MRSNKQTSNGGILVAVVGSMTAAQRAQRALLSAAIRADIVKSDSESGRGCSYGVAFPASQQNNVRTILSATHINVRRYSQDAWSIL
ncbi:MAG: DUF3343 domain-containing protein [Clostridia bacterium]|nr:DUF3343 domain-containing protein [Clostridia bacterium]